MKKILLLTGILITQTIHAGNFDRFISYLNKIPLKERQAKTDSFINANPVLPYIENDTTVIFIFYGNAKTAVISGDFTGWEPSMPMTGVAGANFFYHTIHFEADARIEYKLVIDGKWIVDPKNPRSFTGGTGVNSEVRMPGYIVPPEILPYPDIPHGTVYDTSFFSKKLNNSRPVKIYLPPGYNVQKQYPVIVFHDGIEFVTLANMTNILDYLIAHYEIEPVIGVFVPPIDRSNEYYGLKKDAYTTFIVKELMPVIDHKYATSIDPRKRATFGISAGGNIALYIGMKHPESFGKISAQSSSVQPEISGKYKKSPKMNLEFYLDIGKYDLPQLIPMVDNLTRILRGKNYSLRFKQWHEGHSWGSWETHVRFALIQFFPPG
jgi:enterochelin esterase family protein